jgi:GDPmannose 4,6-dehydratase
MSKKIANFAVAVSHGSQEKLTIGDISVKKEWTFAGDIVDAIYTLVMQDEVFEATIGSGFAYSIEQWLEVCFGLVNKDWHDYVLQQPGFKAEYDILYSNPATIHALGWTPKVSFDALARMMVLS